MAVRPPHYHSITELNETEAFELQVARGLVGGHSALNIFGYNSIVGIDFLALWEVAGAYVFPTAATAMTVTSLAADNGKVLTIIGLDANWNVLVENVVLNAATPAVTQNQFLRINTLIMAVATNTALVTVTAGGITYGQIRAGDGKNQAAIYSVPAGHSFYLMRIDAFSATTSGASKYLTFRNQVTKGGLTLNVAQTTFLGNMQILRQIPFKYTEKSDIQMQAKSSSGTNEVGIFAEGILIKDTIN